MFFEIILLTNLHYVDVARFNFSQFCSVANCFKRLQLFINWFLDFWYCSLIFCSVLYQFVVFSQGKCLTRNLEQPSHLSAVFDWLWSRIVASILWPLHILAKKIVYSKIQSAIGISKVFIAYLAFRPLLYPCHEKIIQIEKF